MSVRSGNYCCSSIRVASIDENKNSHRKINMTHTQWPNKSRTTSSEHTYSSYVKIRDVAQKTCQRRWMIGRSGEKGSGISVLAARHDDDILTRKATWQKVVFDILSKLVLFRQRFKINSLLLRLLSFVSLLNKQEKYFFFFDLISKEPKKVGGERWVSTWHSG